jgi:hypothetical protein
MDCDLFLPVEASGNPKHITSARCGLNYIRAFKQMIDHLKVPTPEGYDCHRAPKITHP